MSLQRRLLLYLLISAPLVWGLALWVSVDRAGEEVNELFDTELIRLARQVQATLGFGKAGTAPAAPPAPGASGAGAADVGDLAIAVWDTQGRLQLADREGQMLAYRPDASGFIDTQIAGDEWRVYYLQSTDGQWLVAAGQKAHERTELVFNLTASQLVPWLLVLPILLAAMAWAVRRALAPVRVLASELQQRNASDLQPIADRGAPSELQPLLVAMNGLFSRIEDTLARERRFTADAAHELRTPLAALRAQWDVARRAATGEERLRAEAKLDGSLDRMDRLVTQMLALSRVDSVAELPLRSEIAWPAVVEEAINDCLALATRRQTELVCEWPPAGHHPLPLMGSAYLLTVMVRNLLDNAIRYAPTGSTVTLRFTETRLEVLNAGEAPAPEQLARVGERFHRPDGQQETGSGLGVSIVQRIAALHGLGMHIGPGEAGQGVRVVVQFAGRG